MRIETRRQRLDLHLRRKAERRAETIRERRHGLRSLVRLLGERVEDDVFDRLRHLGPLRDDRRGRVGRGPAPPGRPALRGQRPRPGAQSPLNYLRKRTLKDLSPRTGPSEPLVLVLRLALEVPDRHVRHERQRLRHVEPGVQDQVCDGADQDAAGGRLAGDVLPLELLRLELRHHLGG